MGQCGEADSCLHPNTPTNTRRHSCTHQPRRMIVLQSRPASTVIAMASRFGRAVRAPAVKENNTAHTEPSGRSLALLACSSSQHQGD